MIPFPFFTIKMIVSIFSLLLNNFIAISIKLDSLEYVMQTDKQRPSKRYKNKIYYCPISLAMDLIGGRWKGVILYYLLLSEKRFCELKTVIPEITDMTLSIQLKKLEDDGLITRTVFGDKPPLKVIYKLTPLGERFGPALEQLCSWGLTI